MFIDLFINVLNSHKVYKKIQEVMMKQLECSTWDQVTEEYPTTSSYKALQEYFIAFREWVCYVKYINCFIVHSFV